MPERKAPAQHVVRDHAGAFLLLVMAESGELICVPCRLETSMSHKALRTVEAGVQPLPRKLQEELAKQLLTANAPDSNTTVLLLRRLTPEKQLRLAQLMDKNSEGALSQREEGEIKQLGREVDEMLLTNSQAIARAMRPELFDQRGQPIRHRFQQALNPPPRRADEPKRRNSHG